MRIVDVASTILKSYEYPHGGWVLIRVRTDEDIEGVGEAFIPNQYGEGAEAAKVIVDRGLKPVVVGEEITDVEKIWERMYANCDLLYDRRGLAIHALSGVDMAVYDALGKTLRVPVHKLLGGCFREKVKVYASSVFVDPENPEVALEETGRYVRQGFKAVKFWGWRGFGEYIKKDIILLRRIREALGENTWFMLDAGRPPSAVEAVRIAKAVERARVDLYWWEEPLPRDDLEGYAKLSGSVDTPIAAGEGELTRFAFKELILRKAVDILQPDLSWVGGITEGKRIAEMAYAWRTPLVPHDWGTTVNTAASLHLVASMPDGFLCEFPITPRTQEMQAKAIPSPMMTELAKQQFTLEDGYVKVPQGPGLGIELDEDAVKKYTYEG